MYDPLLDETVGLKEQLRETQRQLDDERRERKRLRKEIDDMAGNGVATPVAAEATLEKAKHTTAYSKDEIANHIRHSANQLREWLQESLGHPTMRVQINLAGGHGINRQTNQEEIHDFKIDVAVLDINHL